MNKQEEIISFLKVFMEKALPATPGDDYLEIPFLEMGANSLILMQVQQAIENRYKITIEIPMFFEELTNISALVEYIAANSTALQSDKTPDSEMTSEAANASSWLQVQEADHPQSVMPSPPASQASFMQKTATARSDIPQFVTPKFTARKFSTPEVATQHFTDPEFTGQKPNNPQRSDFQFTGDSTLLDSIFTQQMQAASQTITNIVAQQLQFLGEIGVSSITERQTAPLIHDAPLTEDENITSKNTPTSLSSIHGSEQTSASVKESGKNNASEKKSASAPKKPSSSALMHKMLSPLEIRARGLTQIQREHLESLITSYTKRTRKSRELTALYRPVLADSRAAVGFRFTTKEMLYPITGKYGKGARVWDIDGNEYVDITMGQGVILFGHDPDFIKDALENSRSDRLLGPRPSEAGEAARIICELTGMERVTFTNTGTEAVMAAVRLARAATQRNKIVMFENAYHGHADNVMGRAVWNDNNTLDTVPVAPGITQGAVDDLWVLEYDTEHALDFIGSHADEIAAVIVEPVQSRRPDLQPREFLHKLRELTSKTGIIFIFDEMITGFRVHPGGAQAIFGVKADIATYGKVLGGGMPIGVVAKSS
ncbi:MAG: aminotransferase class III-fold pyridoxal phosphate-dependent enzyme [Desulfamplus sp.]|nr:aminotransferase class III-fold pyridoxal phosphate-dependent enzyme [Desulfamplus sp.]